MRGHVSIFRTTFSHKIIPNGVLCYTQNPKAVKFYIINGLYKTMPKGVKCYTQNLKGIFVFLGETKGGFCVYFP